MDEIFLETIKKKKNLKNPCSIDWRGLDHSTPPTAPPALGSSVGWVHQDVTRTWPCVLHGKVLGKLSQFTPHSTPQFFWVGSFFLPSVEWEVDYISSLSPLCPKKRVYCPRVQLQLREQGQGLAAAEWSVVPLPLGMRAGHLMQKAVIWANIPNIPQLARCD